MDIKGFFKRKWNAITDTVSAKLNAVAGSLAARLDARFKENHPITAGLLEDFGISPSLLLHELWNGFLYTSKSVATGLVEVGRGVKDVTVTFLPHPSISSLTQWIPPVMRITWHPDVRTSFFRGVARNLLFSLAATAFLRWPELAISTVPETTRRKRRSLWNRILLADGSQYGFGSYVDSGPHF